MYRSGETRNSFYLFSLISYLRQVLFPLTSYFLLPKAPRTFEVRVKR